MRAATERPFSRSFAYSVALHALLLLLFLFAFKGLFTQTPLMMDVTLIGVTSQGESLGGPTARSGQEPQQVQQAQQNPSNPQPPQPKPDVVAKKPMQHPPAPLSPEAALQKLENAAPIGLNTKPDVTNKIDTTAGIAQQGVAGAPDGSTQIEGQLASRTILKQVKPDYPLWARQQGVAGTVKYLVTVLPDGSIRVSDVQLVQTSGYPELDKDVYDALIQWQFSPLPATMPQVTQSGIIPVQFQLQN